MNQFDGHGSFADPRSDAFGGAMTDIARYEDARNTRLEIKWIAIGGPSCWAFSLQHQVLPEIR